MRLKTYEKLKKRFALTDDESAEVVEYIGKCEDEIHKLQSDIQEYQNMEENRMLVRLPYPVGTQLFIPLKVQGVVEDRIRRWQTNNKGLMFCTKGGAYLQNAIGKSMFLTRKEAELSYQEMYQKFE